MRPPLGGRLAAGRRLQTGGARAPVNQLQLAAGFADSEPRQERYDAAGNPCPRSRIIATNGLERGLREFEDHLLVWEIDNDRENVSIASYLK